MANRQHLAKLKEGPGAWNEWRDSHREVTPDLIRARLGGARLGKANLAGANLHLAELSEAILSGANLAGANCTEARLFRTDLSMSNLSGALLDESILVEANLVGAILSDAVLFGANLNGAFLDLCDLSRVAVGTTSFGDNDLSFVRGLDTVKHVAPSTIGLDTIYKSKGKIPEVFLRGCGAPDAFIIYAKSLVTNPIEYYSCFISYSTKDQEFADRLHSDLQARGVRCWFAPEDLKIGDPFQERIEQSIRIYDKLLVVLSENSVNSGWVEREVNAAFEKEQKQKRKDALFPVRLDDSVMESDRPWAADIRRTRHIGDFRKWKDHDSFQKSLGRLLRDLKSQAPEGK